MSAIPVQLNNLELWALMELAKKRNAHKEASGIKSQKIDPALTDVQLHYIGLKAEYALAKLIGVEIDLTNTRQGDGGVDVVYRDLTIDVKLSTRDLKYRLDKEVVADVIVLAQPLSRTARNGRYYARAERDPAVEKATFAWKNILIVGWISKEEFLRTSNVANFGHIDCNMVYASDMHAMDTLKAFASAKKRVDTIKRAFDKGD